MVLATMPCVDDLTTLGESCEAIYGSVANFSMADVCYALYRFLFSWPNSKCSVMGAEQLTGVLDLIMRQAAKR